MARKNCYLHSLQGRCLYIISLYNLHNFFFFFIIIFFKLINRNKQISCKVSSIIIIIIIISLISQYSLY